MLVAVQVGGMVYTYRKEKADEKQRAPRHPSDSNGGETANPTFEAEYS